MNKNGIFIVRKVEDKILLHLINTCNFYIKFFMYKQEHFIFVALIRLIKSFKLITFTIVEFILQYNDN